jgi:hypothetical protein
VVAALGLVTPALVAVAPAATATPGELTVHVSRAFSPNRDGRKDEARVQYDLPVAGRVKVVVLQGIPGRTMAVAKLGRQGRGTHEWRWDGRGRDGARLDDGYYYVNVTLTTPDGTIVKPHGRAPASTRCSVQASTPATTTRCPRARRFPSTPAPPSYATR